jgi:hypothetical protein
MRAMKSSAARSSTSSASMFATVRRTLRSYSLVFACRFGPRPIFADSSAYDRV